MCSCVIYVTDLYSDCVLSFVGSSSVAGCLCLRKNITTRCLFPVSTCRLFLFTRNPSAPDRTLLGMSVEKIGFLPYRLVYTAFSTERGQRPCRTVVGRLQSNVTESFVIFNILFGFTQRTRLHCPRETWPVTPIRNVRSSWSSRTASNAAWSARSSNVSKKKDSNWSP